MKVTPIIMITLIGFCTNLAVADNFRSTKIEAQSESSQSDRVGTAMEAIQSYLEESEVWNSTEELDSLTKIRTDEPDLIFMSSFERRNDILSIKGSGANKLTVSILIENENTYETNEVEASIEEIESIVREHFDSVTKETEDYSKDLIAENEL